MRIKIFALFFVLFLLSVNTLAVIRERANRTSKPPFLYALLVVKVIDKNKAPIQGASVEIINIGNGNNFEAQTDSNGKFQSKFIPVGKYSITVKMKGYKTTRKDIIVFPNMPILVLSPIQLEED